jgi:hypothetical protein
VFLLDALQAGDPTLDLGRERLDVARRSADEGAEATLDQGDQLGVLGKDGGGGGTVQVL